LYNFYEKFSKYGRVPQKMGFLRQWNIVIFILLRGRFAFGWHSISHFVFCSGVSGRNIFHGNFSPFFVQGIRKIF
jgi:hypothetical protein